MYIQHLNISDFFLNNIMSEPTGNNTINPFSVALKQLDEASKIIGIDKGMHDLLAQPKRILIVSIPTRMDNDEIHVFTGFRSQHNDARGPFRWKRITSVNIDEERHFHVMTWKVPNIPYAGERRIIESTEFDWRLNE